MANDLFSGLGDFFTNLFGAFTGQSAQPSQPQQTYSRQDEDLFGQLFSWMPDGGRAMSNAFSPDRKPQPWEMPSDIQDAQMRNYGPGTTSSRVRNIQGNVSSTSNSVTSGGPGGSGMNYPAADPSKVLDASSVVQNLTDPSNYTLPNNQTDDPKSPVFDTPKQPGSQAYWEATRSSVEDPKTRTLTVAEEMRRDRSAHWQPTANFSTPINDVIDRNATEAGVDPRLARRIAQIESSGDPGAVTGSYKGLYQLSNSEFMKFGGGDIMNAEDNAKAGLKKIAAEKVQLSKALGRDVSPGEVYLAHQQGVGGATKHLQNPDQPAWLSMFQTGEGQQKGETWAKKAIWGNVPDRFKRIFGSVENITSGDFARMWISKVEG